MSIVNFIKDTFGMEADPTGVLAQNYPNYTPNPTYTPEITAGTGKFGGRGLACARAPSATAGIGFLREFQSTGVITNAVTAGQNAQKTLFAWSGWVRIDTVAATVAATPMVFLTSSSLAPTATANIIPLFGILNNTTNGLNLVFPTNYSSFATSPVLVAVQTGLYYFVVVRVTGATAANTLQTSVTVSGATIRDNLATTLSATTFNTSVINRWGEIHSTAFTFTLDDCTMQQVDGTSVDRNGTLLWPAGFTDGEANLPAQGSNDMPLMPPVRSFPMPLNANGSVSQWTPSDSGKQNWECAASDTDFVQATDSGQIDLYKFDTSLFPDIQNIKAVQITETSEKFLSVNPQLKYQAADATTVNFDVVGKNTQRIIAVQEQSASDTPFNLTNLALLEVGNVSL